jgi:tetratricopeptide (TPR) repeat protein
VDPFDLMIWLASDLWGYYAIGFVGLGFFINDLFPLETPATQDASPFHGLWILLGIFMVLAAAGSFWRFVSSPNPPKGTKRKAVRKPYPLWFSGLLALAGIGFLLYALFPLRSHLTADYGATVGLPGTYWIAMIDFLAIAITPTSWFLSRLAADRSNPELKLRKQMMSTDPAVASAAAFQLGQQLKLKNPVGARVVYAQGLEMGHATWSAACAVNLAILDRQDKKYDDAIAMYDRAIAFGDPMWVGRAEWGKGGAYTSLNNRVAACAAYERALSSTEPHVKGTVALRLGELRQADGDLDGAKEAFEQAVASGYTGSVPKATVALAEVAKEQVRRADAREQIREAAGNAKKVAAAQCALATVLIEQGSLPEAKALLAPFTTDASTPEHVVALRQTGLIAVRENDEDRAVDYFQKAFSAGGADESLLAGLDLADQLEKIKMVEEAATALRAVADSERPSIAADAMRRLGVLWDRQGKLDEAETAFRDCMSREDAKESPRAANALGALLFNKKSDLTGAELAFAVAAGAQDAGIRRLALSNLGFVCEKLGWKEQALWAFHQVQSMGTSELATKASAREQALRKQLPIGATPIALPIGSAATEATPVAPVPKPTASDQAVATVPADADETGVDNTATSTAVSLKTHSGKPLQLSGDREYWWDGTNWTHADTMAPPHADHSDDGHYWWDGLKWRLASRVSAPVV